MVVALAQALGGFREVDGRGFEDRGGFLFADRVTGDAVEAAVGADELLAVGDLLGVGGRFVGFLLGQAVLVVQAERQGVGVVREAGHAGDQPRTRFVFDLTGDELAHPVVAELLAEPGEGRDGRVMHRFAFDVLLGRQGVAQLLGFAVDLGPRADGAVARVTGDAVEVLDLAFGVFGRGVLLERGEVGGEESLQRGALRGGEGEVRRGAAGLVVGGKAALVAGGEDLRERRLGGRRHAGVAVEAAGADDQSGAAGGVTVEGLALDLAAVGEQVGGQLRRFLFFEAEVRHARGRVVLGRILQVFDERGGVPLVGDVSHRHAFMRILAFEVRALVAGDATEVGEEFAALRGELEVDRAGLGGRALREHRREIGGLLGGVRTGQRLGHQRMRADGVRVVDPVSEEGALELRAELGKKRRVLAVLWHARAFRGQARGVGMAGRAVHLREEQAAFTALGGEVEVFVGGVREARRRDGLERKIFRRPAQARERVALRRAGDLGHETIQALVELDGLDAGAVEQRLAVEAELELAGSLDREFEGAAHRRLQVAFPLRGERTDRQERRRRLARGHVEREEAVRADVALARGGEGDLQAREILGGEGGREGRGEQAEEAAETHGGGTLPLGGIPAVRQAPNKKARREPGLRR